jgi:hypothetical protein
MAALVLVSLGAISACSKSNPAAPDAAVATGGRATGSYAETIGDSSSIAAVGGPEQVKDFPVEWTLTAAECPALWADSLSGQGTVRMKTRTTSLGNGTFYLHVTEKAAGTATDSTGATFPFAYSNSFKFVESPPAFDLSFKDKFTIKGPSKTLTIRISVQGHFKVDAEGNVVLNTVKSIGPIACDPI